MALLFKVGAAPFHFWVADVYEGLPLHLTLYFFFVPKFTFYFLFLNLFFLFFLFLCDLQIFFFFSIFLLYLLVILVQFYKQNLTFICL
jgi:NADH-quinone oxidoreductase subunit N